MSEVSGHQQRGGLEVLGVMHHALRPVPIQVGFIDFEDSVNIRVAIGEHLVMIVHHFLIHRREHLHGRH